MDSASFQEKISKSIQGFIPNIVQKNYGERMKDDQTDYPHEHSLRTIVMFIDVAGFTNMTAKLSTKGKQGPEFLAKGLNAYMEMISQKVGHSGGDIFKYVGDAMIVLWSPPNDDSVDADDFQKKNAINAIQTAIEIQEGLNQIEIEGEESQAVKICFGVGDVKVIYVGGILKRAEFLPIGEPLIQAFKCERLSPGGGTILVPEPLRKMVSGHFEFEQVPQDEVEKDDDQVYLVKSQIGEMQSLASLEKIKTKFERFDLTKLKSKVETFIPKSLIQFEELDLEAWSCNLAKISTVFCSLDFNITQMESDPEAIKNFHNAITIIQKCLFQSRGNLNKVLIDDKGTTLFFVFGIHPLCHVDDAERSVRCSMMIKRELNKVSLKPKFGICTGNAFTGVLGTTGGRREFSILGDKVNLSSRLMQSACNSKDCDIFLDEETHYEASNGLLTTFHSRLIIKDSTKPTNLYKPMDIYEKITLTNQNLKDTKSKEDALQMVYDSSKDITMNTIIPDMQYISNNYVNEAHNQKKFDELEFSKEERKLPKIYGDHRNFLINIKSNMMSILNGTNPSKLFLINGGYGSGKSFIVKKLQQTMTEEFAVKKDQKLFVLYHSCSPIEANYKYNGIRILFSRLLKMVKTFDAKLTGTDEEIVTLLSKDIISEKDKAEFDARIKKVLNKMLIKKMRQIRITKDEELIESADIKVAKTALQGLLSKMNEIIKSMCEKEGATGFLTTIVLDNVHSFDLESLKIMASLTDNVKNLAIIATFRNNHQPRYTVLKYIEDLTAILKAANCNFEKLTITKQSLTDEDLESIVHQYMSLKYHQEFEIENSVMDYIKDCCNRNPQDLMHMTDSLVEESWIFIRDHKIFTTKKLRDFWRFKNFNQLCVLPVSMHNKYHNTLNALSPLQLLVLYMACCWGDTFDDYILTKVETFKQLDPTTIKKLLVELERYDIIELLRITADLKVYRFVDPALRKMLHDRMLFEHRDIFCKIYKEIIRIHPLPDYLVPQGGKKEDALMQLMFYQYRNENLADEIKNEGEKKLGNQIKQSLIVQHISSSLKESNSTNTRLCFGKVQKYDSKTSALQDRFAVLNKLQFFYYSNEETYKISTENYITKVELGDITMVNQFVNNYKTVDGENVVSYEQDIYTNMCYKLKKALGPRVFKFIIPSYDELQKWFVAIDIVRLNANYINAVAKYGDLSLPFVDVIVEKDHTAIEEEQYIKRLGDQKKPSDADKGKEYNTKINNIKELFANAIGKFYNQLLCKTDVKKKFARLKDN